MISFRMCFWSLRDLRKVCTVYTDEFVNHLKGVLSMIYRGYVLAVILMFAILGCSKSDTTAPQSGTGTLQINMIDSPASYDNVNIVVDSVQVHISTSDSTSGWMTLNHTSATYDLLTLVNGANAVIGSAIVPVGQYSQIRLHIGSGSNVVINGVTKSLSTPSGSQSGIKLNINSTIQPDITYVLTIDFDANKSIVKTGNPNNPTYILKPVIRAIATGTTGIIAGTVFPSTTMPTILGFNLVDSISTTADATGGFKIVSLPPATYSVYIAPKDTTYSDTTITNVDVTASNTISLGTITLRHK
jgi:hypothetical protein